MRLNLLKIFIIIIAILNQYTAYSKETDINNYNKKHLSSYFSALLSYNNQSNDKALKFFNSSKSLASKHNGYLKEYVYSLIADGQVSKAIKQVKYWKNKNNSDFFEAHILLFIDSLKNKNYIKASKYISELEFYQAEGTYEYIIYETLKSYNKLFLDKVIKNSNQNFGKLSLITNAFQNCYLNSNKSKSYFLNLINSEDGSYSRYLFFYLGNIIENKEYDKSKTIVSTINPISNSLLISQAKKWIDQSEYQKINDHFSCKVETDVIAEFFFLISNLYASQQEYEKSNFYLFFSNYLNSKFYFNLSLLVENYYLNNNFNLAKKFLEEFGEKDDIYRWYKTKKLGQIIAEDQSHEESLNFVEKNFKKFNNPNTKILFDMANIYKRFKNYDKAIEFYTLVLNKTNNKSQAYADTLYRRGGSYERIGKFKKADNDLKKSLEIIPEEPYVMNYLAYSWLERNYNIDEAMQMLERAYQQKSNDPYIIDSIGWGYYLIGDYEKAEKYLIKAVRLMPDDPIVNDHYGDILWRLDRKLQAKYFWKNVLKFEDTENEMKEKILEKLLKGLDRT